jgi:hypothetical protein
MELKAILYNAVLKCIDINNNCDNQGIDFIAL